MPIAKPVWENKWGPNTIISVLGFSAMLVGGLVAWGYVVAEFRGALAAHTVEIDKLDKRLTAVETKSLQFENHELRIQAVEQKATDAATAMRAVETALNGLGADVRVVKEILTRLERNGGTHQ